MSNNNAITYRQVGDYLIPNLALPTEETKISLGKWGMMHKDYLRKHKPVVFASLLTQGKLWQYLADIDNHTQQMFDTLFEQMKEADCVTEQLKVTDQMEWVQRMNSIQSRVIEVLCKELIYI